MTSQVTRDTYVDTTKKAELAGKSQWHRPRKRATPGSVQGGSSLASELEGPTHGAEAGDIKEGPGRSEPEGMAHSAEAGDTRGGPGRSV